MNSTVTVPAQRRPPLREPERRGRTEISPRVVIKIACHAAREVPEVRDVQMRLSGRPRGRVSSARVHGDWTTVRLNVSVAYPSPLRAVGDRLRQHVIERVTSQTGLKVVRLDVIMTDLGMP
ncbi:Asp23/Gls24 family envelope stress response protein [Nonomuraea sp. NPDC046802]|uniref:Asp23/Gls24 family envelope stress response protein n=1 Tax=Nonomuraea sp. NPDC046802 TaxID=3154919 RepID=UPI003411A063